MVSLDSGFSMIPLNPSYDWNTLLNKPLGMKLFKTELFQVERDLGKTGPP